MAFFKSISSSVFLSRWIAIWRECTVTRCARSQFSVTKVNNVCWLSFLLSGCIFSIQLASVYFPPAELCKAFWGMHPGNLSWDTEELSLGHLSSLFSAELTESNIQNLACQSNIVVSFHIHTLKFKCNPKECLRLQSGGKCSLVPQSSTLGLWNRVFLNTRALAVEGNVAYSPTVSELTSQQSNTQILAQQSL